MLGEAHALIRQTIEVGRADLLLAVRAQLTIPQVVGEYEDHVGSTTSRSGNARSEIGQGHGCCPHAHGLHEASTVHSHAH